MVHAFLLLIALATSGIQWGWEPSAGGGNTYIVQVEPELIDTFRDHGYSSDVPPELRDIRRIEIRVGSGALPHQGETALKVPDKGADDATKPPRLDATAADAAAKHDSSQEPHLADDTEPAKNLARAADPKPFANAAPKPVEQTSFKQTEPASNDGNSTNSKNSNAADNDKSLSDGAKVSPPPRSPSELDSPAHREPSDTPSIPLLGAIGALIVSGAGNLYLGWVHLGTRRRYRDVVGQLRETDLPIAIEPHNEL